MRPSGGRSGGPRPQPTCDSGCMAETRTYRVSLVSMDASEAADPFFKYVGQQLPEAGEIIHVVRFLRGRPIRARVTRVDANTSPPIAATQIE